MICLDDLELGRLDLDCGGGYVVERFEIGWPTVREVTRPRPLDHGTLDDTAYLGERAVTVALRLDQRKHPTQTLIDRLLPYIAPWRRPRLCWAVQRDGDPCNAIPPPGLRSLVVRGVDAPTVIDGPRYQTLVVQFAGQALIEALDETCETWPVGEDDSNGRAYDLEYDRVYPASPPTGLRVVVNDGTAPAHWRLTLFGQMVDPVVVVNGVEVSLTGLTMTATDTLVIDTGLRVILANGDSNESRYGIANYAEWEWSELRLRPGVNEVRLLATNTTPTSIGTLCWRSSWL